MAKGKELPRCSLDDFLENNKQEIRIHSPEEVFFVREGKRVSLTKRKDLASLKGQGFLLESPYMKNGSNISRGFGCAYILDSEGNKTGYWLINHGLRNASGYRSWYQLEKSF